MTQSDYNSRMVEDSLSLRIETKGLTLKETRQLREMLQCSASVSSVEDVAFSGSLQASAALYASIDEFNLLVQVTKHAVAVGAGLIALDAAHAFVKKSAELLAEDFAKWWRSKSPGTSSIPVDVTIYGPDDKPVKVVRVMR